MVDELHDRRRDAPATSLSTMSRRLGGAMTYRCEAYLRTIIVHYHIFKNSGSSLDHILRLSFGDGWAPLEGSTPTSLLTSEDLLGFVNDHPRIVAVSSHLLRPPAPSGLNVLPVVLIRHPLDRAFSVYSQMGRNSGDLPSEVAARQLDFSEFVLWCLDNKSLGGMVIANYQVVHLSPASFRSGHIYNAVATRDDLRHAVGYLIEGACFGVVDRFDEMIGRLRMTAERVDLSIASVAAAENVTSGRPLDLQARLEAAREQLGRRVYDRYRRENQLDYQLYDWARRHSPAVSLS